MEEKISKKVIRHWMPLLIICYIIFFLDRINISVAALKMNTDIGITPTIFGLAAGIFFWTYAMSEIPSNYVLSRVGFRVWIPRIMITWGIVVIAMSAVQGGTSLTISRMLLGVAEAGFSPAMIYFVSCWLPRRKRGIALSIMLSSSCLSGLFVPLLAYIMVWTDGLSGIAGWRWIFIVTGIPAVITGIVCIFKIRDRPAQATFLDQEERDWLTETLAAESEELASTEKSSFVDGLKNVRVIALFLVFLFFMFGLFGYQYWLPQMLATFNFSTVQVGWFAALPPLISIGPMIWWARHSDRTGERVMHFTVAALIASVGFALSAAFIHNAPVAILGFCFAGLGLYIITGIFWTIPMNILSGASLAAAIGLINGLGSVGGFFGPQLVGITLERTGSYALGVGIFAVALLVSACGGVMFKFDQQRRQKSVEHTAPSTPIVTHP
ncbi:MFS transporter (plasmid) [Rhodococcus sp. USK10]|uniref:MFS transporter n=1 Tax=Rhodococcus sp. USK10 TaxID=2789739 RepID=UPI001C600E6A|nr:MFS transporter [Rhodococcus sp. USK10]QYB00162.1 MFS transporter [Rhodococcus sp. USK10]